MQMNDIVQLAAKMMDNCDKQFGCGVNYTQLREITCANNINCIKKAGNHCAGCFLVSYCSK